MNNISLIGNITKDIELRTTQTGKSVATVSVAYNDGYGEKQTTHYFDVQVWDKQAENLAKYCFRGSKIAVTGKLIQQRWEHEGKNQSKVLIQAFSITFLDTKKENDKIERVSFDDTEEEKEQHDPFKEFGQEVVINDSDLPF